MQHWLQMLLEGKVTSFGGAGIGIALVLVLALRLLLPQQERKSLRIPLAMVALHVLIILTRAALPEGAKAHQWLSVAALFLILAAIGNCLFLLSVDWFLSHRLKRAMPRIFRDILSGLVYAIVTIVTLRSMGVELGSLITTSALLTAVIGLSLQETLGNLFAGLALEAQRPFAVGDWIQFDDNQAHIGHVVEINWRATKIRTNDRVEILVPNGTLAKLPISNFSQPSNVSRRSVEVSAAYEVPPMRVQETILRGIEGLSRVLKDPPPQVFVSGFGESGIDYTVLFFIDEFKDRSLIDSSVRSRIWYSFARAGITIPFPIRDTRWRDSSKEAMAEKDSRIAERERDLRHVDFLHVLPDAALHALAEATGIKLFTSGEPVIRKGDEGDELFIVRSGEVAVMIDHEGDEREIARLGPGKFFGEMSLMTGEHRSATVRALEESEMLVVGHDAFKSILLAHPEAAERISKSLARRQAQLEQRSSVAPEGGKGQEVERENVLLSRIRSFFKL